MNGEAHILPPGRRGRARGYALVLSGGGARGLAHVGALRALEHIGYPPAAIVGVSMGAIVGTTYGLNPDWYRSLVNMDTSGLPKLPDFSAPGVGNKLRNAYLAQQFVAGSWFGWGLGEATHAWGLNLLRDLTLRRDLAQARLPVCVTATDLGTGERVSLCDGPAWEAVYASSALAGILPPAKIGGRMLVDGGYADLAPVDIARQLVDGPVIAFDVSRRLTGALPTNGLQAMIRGLEICQNEHASLRFAAADLVLKPHLDPPVDTLQFEAKRRTIAAGVMMIRSQRESIVRLLG